MVSSTRLTDRLLHYHADLERAPLPLHSFYALAACVCAAISVGLAFAVKTGSLNEDLYALAVPAAVFTELAALMGCILAAIEKTRRRTFLWLAIVLILVNPFLYTFIRDIAWEVFGVLITF